MGYLRVWIWASEGHLGTGLEGQSGGSIEVNSRSILGLFWTHSGPNLRNLMETTVFTFIWPWVGPWVIEQLYMGPWAWSGGYPV